MLKWKITCLALVVCFAFSAQAQEDVSYTARVQRYISQYKTLAIKEQKRSGIPAAVTLGQGILETQAGGSELATQANNHFGIKCKKEWTGETFAHTDDAPNECFRKYPKAEDSYKDHSDYLKTSARYAALFKLSPTDYAGWAVGLKKCGYATNPRYAQQLIKIIEDFKLQEFTYVAMNDDAEYEHDGTAVSKPGTRNLPVMDADDPVLVRARLQTASSPAVAAAAAATPPPVAAKAPAINNNISYAKENNIPKQPDKSIQSKAPPVTDDPGEAKQIENTNRTLESAKPVTVNGLKAVYAFKGELPFQYALKFNIRYEHLLDMNDLPDAPLASNMFIYLEKKSNKGQRPYHIVKPGETLAQVSQVEGVQLRRIMAMNHLSLGEEPEAGTQLYMQDNAPAKPQLTMAANAGTQPMKGRIDAPAARGNYIDKNTISQGNPAFDNGTVIEKPLDKPATRTVTTIPPNNNNATAKKTLGDGPSPELAKRTSLPAVAPVTTKPVVPAATANVVASKPIETKPAATQPQIIDENAPAPKAKQRPQPADNTLAANKPVETKPVVQSKPAINTPKEEPVKMSPPVEKPLDPRTPEEDNRREATTLKPTPVSTPKAAPPAQPKKAEPVVVTKPAEEKKEPEMKPVVIEKPVVEKPVAETKHVVIEKPAPITVPREEEPMDELAKLKARLDRVVYVNDNKVATANKNINTGSATASNDAGKFYTVREGDTAFTIAKDNNISMKQLMDWNDMDFEQIKVGQKLRIKE